MQNYEDPLQLEIANKNNDTLARLDQMIAEAVSQMDEGKSHVQIDFGSDLELCIRIKGDEWDERLDERIAKFVVELQHSLDALHQEAANYELTKDRRVRVKVKLEKGSSMINVELGKYLEKAFGNMTPTQTMVVLIVGITAIGAGYATKKILEYKENIKKKAEDEETKRSLTKALERVATLEKDLEAPSKKLVNSMSKDDTIQLPGGDDPLTKTQAKQLFPRSPRSKKLRSNVFGEFYVLSIETSEIIPVVELEQDDTVFKAKLPLVGDGLKTFFNQLMNDTEKRQHKAFELQIVVDYNAKGILDASISAVGSPGEEMDSLDTILKNR